jgi:gliding motility-associated-like protein
MKKHLLLYLSICIYGFSSAQSDDCQEIVQLILSTSTTETIETDPATGITTIYYDMCIGETLTLQASAEFPENNTTYFQSVANTSFTWYMDEVIESNLQNFSYIFTNSGGHIISLYAEDTNGCITPAPVNVFVRVGTTPSISLDISPSTICPGVVTTVGAGSDINFNSTIITDGWESLPCEDEFSEPLYLPDGSGAVYSTDIVLTCFGEGQVLTNVNDILSVDINIEHSYTGDLDILLTAPNGVQVTLFEQAGGGTWFGEATDMDATETNPGIGYDYGWSMNPTYNGTMADGMIDNTTPPAGGGFGNILNSDTYLPTGDLNDFIGTNLNGTWTITIVDNLMIDNGWIFSWGISLDQDIIPSAWSFDNSIVDQYFLPESSIISNLGTSIAIQPEPGVHTYTYEVVDNFGCVFSEDISITASSYINPTEVISNDYCGGEVGEIILQISGGTPGYIVDWSTGETGAILEDLSENTYFYTITDDLGCDFSGYATIDNIVLELEFNINTANDHCNQGLGNISLNPINGDGPYSYDWSNSTPNQASADNLIAGSYLVNVEDDLGCIGQVITDIINIPGPNAYFDQSHDTVVYVDGLVQFINFSSADPLTYLTDYDWSFGNGQFSSEEQPEYNFNQMGTFLVQLTVTDEGGCTDSFQSEVISVEDYYIWTPTAFTPNGDGNNELYQPILHNIIESSFELFIYDRWGKLVFQSTDVNSGWDGIRQDNGTPAEIAAYSFLARFNTHRNTIQEETGSFILLK